MRKSVLFFSFAELTMLLLGGLFYPSGWMMYLASAAVGYTVLRIVLLVMLASLLATQPPRNIVLRALIGLSSVALSVWCLQSTYENHTQLLDALSILGACAAMGITVLEYAPRQRKIESIKRQMATV